MRFYSIFQGSFQGESPWNFVIKGFSLNNILDTAFVDEKTMSYRVIVHDFVPRRQNEHLFFFIYSLSLSYQ